MVVACNSIPNIMIVTDRVVTLSFGYTTTSYAYTILSLSTLYSVFIIWYTIYHICSTYIQIIVFWYTRVFRQPSNSIHSSQFHGLCSTKSSNEMLQNLPYLYITKTHTYVLSFFNSMLYSIFPIYEFPKSQNSQNRHRQQCKQGKEIKEIFNPFVGTFHKTKILKLGRVPCPK